MVPRKGSKVSWNCGATLRDASRKEPVYLMEQDDGDKSAG